MDSLAEVVLQSKEVSAGHLEKPVASVPDRVIRESLAMVRNNTEETEKDFKDLTTGINPRSSGPWLTT